MPIACPRGYLTAAALLPVVALRVAASGAGDRGDDAQDAGAAKPSGETSTKGLTPKLALNVKQGNQIIGEGTEAFEKRLRELRGHPVVVNQWGVLVRELPLRVSVLRRGGEAPPRQGRVPVARLTGRVGQRREVPGGVSGRLPEHLRPGRAGGGGLGGGQAWPTTMFFDRSGGLVNVKLGAYATAELLEQDIERWALGRGS